MNLNAEPATAVQAGFFSGLYTGKLRHRRFWPRTHEFTYPTFMALIDLDEIEEIFNISRWCSFEKFNLLSFYRKDYFSHSSGDLKNEIQNFIFEKTGERLVGSVRMLTHLRTLGFCFNPLTVIYCYDGKTNLKYLILDVTNTPWGQRHQYVMPFENGREQVFDKTFHVSPFLPMDLHYKVRVTAPALTTVVHMENHDAEKLVFDATMTISRTELNHHEISKIAVQHAFMTYKVLTWIYIQAFVLFFIKRFRFYSHPKAGVTK